MSQTPIASINKIAKDIRPPHQQNVANVRRARVDDSVTVVRDQTNA